MSASRAEAHREPPLSTPAIAALRRLDTLAAGLRLEKDETQRDPVRFADRAVGRGLARRDAAVRRALSRLAVDPSVAEEILGWLMREVRGRGLALGWSPARAVAAARLLQYAALAARPIETAPHFAYHEWGGWTIARLHRLPRPVAESWPFWSDRGGIGPAVIPGTEIAIGKSHVLGPVTLRDLALRVPAVLGPAGVDPANAEQKYFFAKLIDPSDFPRFAYVGFRPDAVAALGAGAGRLRQRFARLLWEERARLGALRDLVHDRVDSEAAFRELRAAYKSWAIAEAEVGWPGETGPAALYRFAARGRAAEIARITAAQSAIRREITGLLHRIDFADGEAILVPSPTVHGIAGLSGQLHPRAFPKDEVWIYKEVADARGRHLGWGLVEPQRSFDRTESGFDFFTPFAWTAGGVGFRKAITRPYLGRFVRMMDAVPRPRAAYVVAARPAAANRRAQAQGGAVWWDTVNDLARWPHFVARELRVGPAGGTAGIALDPASFSEVHVTGGEVELSLSPPGGSAIAFRLTARQPLLLPASLPARAVTLRASGRARVQWFTRPLSASARARERCPDRVVPRP
ncbi:MAG: hypothetical protein L0027_07375 [Candidatus Rokubacteria bacterium]|nr:hypothetical protein [Candidatus Rokubacteria bacterium]